MDSVMAMVAVDPKVGPMGLAELVWASDHSLAVLIPISIDLERAAITRTIRYQLTEVGRVRWVLAVVFIHWIKAVFHVAGATDLAKVMGQGNNLWP